MSAERIDAIELAGVTAFAEQMAKQLTQDPSQQALIVEGMRATFLNRQHQHPEGVDKLFDERTAPQRFFWEQKEDCIAVWDFNILLNAAALRAEWLLDGRLRLPSFRRDTDPIIIPASVAKAYVEYLALACPNALPFSADAALRAGSRSTQEPQNSKDGGA
jgi:hypothetical protein